MKSDRIFEMERYICQNGSVSMEELRRQFDVSMNTVRRDVTSLLRRGTIEKIYGGVRVRASDSTLTSYEIRRGASEKAKIAIGQRAAELVQDGDVIFIDSGTTTLHMIDFLMKRKELTIITNNLEVMIRALPHENLTIISLPGQVQRKTNSLTDTDAVRFLDRFNIRTAFMAATGVSTRGATNSFPLEFEIKKRAVEHSEQAVLLVSREKFGVTGLMTYAPMPSFSSIVTDQEPPEDYLALIQQAGVQLLIAKP